MTADNRELAPLELALELKQPCLANRLSLSRNEKRDNFFNFYEPF
jgi:hypothetical protein